MLRKLLTFVSTVLLGACSQHFGKPAEPGPAPIVSQYTVTRDVKFTPAEWPQPLLADIYRPVGAGPFPSVLLIHGGAWKRGDRAQVESLARRIAARGYLVMNTTYRLVPEYIFPAQLQDVQQAVRWMRASGAIYGIDPARVGAFGYSAGGHLAALLGGIADDPKLGDPQTRLRVVVAGGTPTDLTKYEGGKLVPAFIGGSREEKFETYRAASPITYVNAGDPPVFIYHASLDHLVPLDHAIDYKAALDKAGITNELFIIRGHGHISGFFADGAAVNAALDFMDRYLR
jgi:acetyl esterase/lipase